MAPTRSPRSRFSPNSVRYQRVNQEIEFSQIEEITNEMLPSERNVWHGEINEFLKNLWILNLKLHCLKVMILLQWMLLWFGYIGVGDEMCWRQLWDVGDGFDRFCHQHPLSFNMTFCNVGQQQPKDVTNIEILSLTSKNCHQDTVTIIHLSPTSM